MADRSATSTLFGFDFQTNAAIVLMLENIKDMKTIRMEGHEDIEINLNDDSSILAQAKAVVNGSYDFTNVLTNLKKALASLNDANAKCPSVKQLIYITNSANPLNITAEKHVFAGLPTYREYATLPPKSKKKIDDIMSKISCSFDKSKLLIQTFPFETDNDQEKYKSVINSIRDFISSIGDVYVNSSDLHKIWQNDIFKSGTRKDAKLKLTKSDIIWPAIVLVTNNMNLDDENIDESEADEINRLYKNIINTCTEKYEFVTKVLYSYNGYGDCGDKRLKMRSFIESKYNDYMYLIDGTTVNDDIKSHLIKIILRNVLTKRFQIDNIKKATNL
ncbi:MAG: hypothetical protein J6T37_06880 [Bacteroidales bacterium]|nr:hypothetical protein [Bacteroidales bacterium]